MSTPPPPPPPSPFGNQPPPQQPYGAPPPAYSAPPGYTPYGAPGAQGAVQSSKGLSKAMIILYAAVVAAAALLALAYFKYKGVVNDALTGQVTEKDHDSAKSFLGLAVILQYLLMLASAILTALWSKRIVANAKTRGVSGVSTGLAAGGWFIPIGWLFVGFSQLRKAVKGVGGVSKSLALWQGAFIVQTIAGFLNFNNETVYLGTQKAVDQISRQATVSLITVVILVAATIFAAKSAKEIDAAVTGG